MPIAHLLVFRKKYCGAKLLVREAYSVVLPWLWASFCRPVFSRGKNVKRCLTGMQVPTIVTFLYFKKQTNKKTPHFSRLTLQDMFQLITNVRLVE